LNINEIFQAHKQIIEDYCYQREDNPRLFKDVESFLEYIRNRIIDFGYGRTTFHTADIELLLKLAEANATKE